MRGAIRESELPKTMYSKSHREIGSWGGKDSKEVNLKMDDDKANSMAVWCYLKIGRNRFNFIKIPWKEVSFFSLLTLCIQDFTLFYIVIYSLRVKYLVKNSFYIFYFLIFTV